MGDPKADDVAKMLMAKIERDKAEIEALRLKLQRKDGLAVGLGMVAVILAIFCVSFYTGALHVQR